MNDIFLKNHNIDLGNDQQMENKNETDIKKYEGDLDHDTEDVINEASDVKSNKDSIFDDNGKEIKQVEDKLQHNISFILNGIKYKTDDKGRIESINGVFVGDDNGKEYRDADGNPLSNCSYVIDGKRYDTDDNGDVYMIDNKLKPNTMYELGGNRYITDDKGRIICCQAKPHRARENTRNNDAQKLVGGENRLENDQGGHIVSRDLGGDSGTGNLVPMDSRINMSDYKRMENSIKSDLDDGKNVSTKTIFTYSDDSNRPDTIEVEVNSDGSKTTYIFDNNMDGALIDQIPENGKLITEAIIDETGGTVSSIVKVYDEKNNLVKTVIRITYTDDNGKNYRREVNIRNNVGGNY